MIRILLTLILVILSVPALAVEMPMKDFGHIPIQNEGRIKPLDTFARVTLKSFSGRDRDATAWLAETLFDPLQSVTRPVFLVRNANLRHRLGLEERLQPLYSYQDLIPGLSLTSQEVSGLAATPGPHSPDEQDLLALHDKALTYTQLLRSFSLILPLNVELPKKWDHMKGRSYLDLRKIERDVEDATKKIIARKGDDPSAYTDDERKIALLSYQMRMMGDAAASNETLRVIPVAWSEAGEWLSPWAVLQAGQGSPASGELLQVWRDLAKAWQTQDATLWQTASAIAAALPLTQASLSGSSWKIEAELLYNALRPFVISTGFYALAFVFVLGFFMSGKSGLRFAALGTLSGGIAIHTFALVTRVALLERPPVSTLYESLVFVGVVCTMIGALLEYRARNGSGILIASISGVFLGLMAESFAAESDTFKLLSAVLNTQFWLATHVVCITFGYGWCVVASVMAHLQLASRAFGHKPESYYAQQATTLMHICVTALLFTATGTILGGIWADQSWGRFWGWDPKENGALLIVLWLVWLMHGKLSFHLQPVALLAAQAFLGVIVGLAWLGVNLLGVGLHSYGFTDGLFRGLGLFIAIEILLIGTLWYKTQRHAA